jgi:hypothetical protein
MVAKRLTICVGLTLLIASSVAEATDRRSTSISGEKFLYDCDSPIGVRYGVCIGFVNGIVNEFELERLRQGKPACDFSKKTIGEYIDILRAYTKEHPEALAENADVLIDHTVQQLCN